MFWIAGGPTISLEEYSKLPICPGCGNTLWDDKPCGRCAALRPNPEAQHTAMVLGVMTGRLTPIGY
jgi:hypothetical protein